MYVKMVRDSIEKILSKTTQRTRYSSLCSYVKPGVFECRNGEYVVALYRIKHWAADIHALSQLEYIYSLKRFLDVFQIENCRSIFLADVEPLDASSYITKLDNKLQMKLIELEMDKSNVKLQNYVKKLIETRKKILMGVKPIKITNIVALVCNNNVDPRDVDKVVINVKNVLNIDLDPLIERRYAEAVANFC